MTRRHSPIRIGAAAVLFIASILAPGWAGEVPKGVPVLRGNVVRVVDGDTFIAMVEGRRESVRLIGIDAPESQDNARVRKQTQNDRLRRSEVIDSGREAKRFLRALLKRGARVHLEFDVVHRDHYGRLLCYVYLKDGRMLNEVIVRSGYAWASSYPPNVKHQKLLQEAQRHAEAHRAGLWKEK